MASKKKTKSKKKEKKFEFSKLIIIFETTLVAYVSYKVIEFAEMCILSNYLGSLAFLTTMITVVWAAYGTSVSFYYGKAGKENVPKITAALEKEKMILEKEISQFTIPQQLSDVDCDLPL